MSEFCPYHNGHGTIDDCTCGGTVSDTPTPRTDAYYASINKFGSALEAAYSNLERPLLDFARQLERDLAARDAELAQAREELALVKNDWDKLSEQADKFKWQVRDTCQRAERAEAELAQKNAALEKINAIRNSIIGFATVNWSEHIYPLVAALDAAGCQGEGYPKSRENAGTLVEQLKSAEAELARVREERDAAFKMSKCECSSDECCVNLVNAHQRAERAEEELARVREELERTKAEMHASRSTKRYQAMRHRAQKAERERDEAREIAGQNKHDFSVARIAQDRAEAERDAAVRDAERLDWYCEQGAAAEVGVTPGGSFFIEVSGKRLEGFESFRAAIDAAIGRKP